MTQDSGDLRLPVMLFGLVLGVTLGAVSPAQGAQEGPQIERQTDNLTLVDHRAYDSGSDMQFQRRAGPHRVAGKMQPGPRDYLFAGADSFAGSDRPADGVGIHVFDVTDPAAIAPVAAVHCLGYHSDIAVYDRILVQTIDDAASNGGCRTREDPDGIDMAGHEGLRIFDVSDPARPRVVRFIGEDELGGGVHNSTVVGWAGLLYLSTNDLPGGLNNGGTGSRFAYVDLNDPDFPVTLIPMSKITPAGSDDASCHDIGMDPEHKIAFCAAVNQTFIWDVSDPRMPQHISTILNPAIFLHHGARLAPDGRTLVVNDELGGAIAGFGCLGQGSGGTAGALWFYDVTDPAAATLTGSFSTTQLNPAKNFCTSHWYNFIPGTELLVVGWYGSGMFVVDYSDPAAPAEHANFRPAGTNYWSAYYWHGALYGNSFRGLDGMGGLWVLTMDGLGDEPPAAQDEGTSWGRWKTAAASGAEQGSDPRDEGPPNAGDEDTRGPARNRVVLPATGGTGTLSLAGLLLAWASTRLGLRRRGRVTALRRVARRAPSP